MQSRGIVGANTLKIDRTIPDCSVYRRMGAHLCGGQCYVPCVSAKELPPLQSTGQPPAAQPGRARTTTLHSRVKCGLRKQCISAWGATCHRGAALSCCSDTAMPLPCCDASQYRLIILIKWLVACGCCCILMLLVLHAQRCTLLSTSMEATQTLTHTHTHTHTSVITHL